MRDAAIDALRPLNRVERDAYQDAVDEGLSALRDRDEV